MVELKLVIHDEEGVAGAGPGGTSKNMEKVTLNDVTVGYLSFQEYPRGGGTYEGYMPDQTTLLMRDRDSTVIALALARRSRAAGVH